MNNDVYRRKRPHLKDYDYSSEGVYFVTICTHNRQNLLSSPRPMLFDVVCAYKSLTTRECKKLYPVDKLFQTSFYEHIIRDQEDYNEKVRYIEANPLRWILKNKDIRW